MSLQRLLVVYLFLFCCLPLPSLAQPKTSLEEAKILALEKRWTDAYKDHNIGSVTSLLAEDFVITVEDGRVFGKIGYITHTADSSVQVDVAEQTDLRVHMHGNIAVVTGGYHETGTSRGARYEYRDRFTDVWMKIDGQWQLIASQYSIPSRQ